MTCTLLWEKGRSVECLLALLVGFQVCAAQRIGGFVEMLDIAACSGFLGCSVVLMEGGCLSVGLQALLLPAECTQPASKDVKTASFFRIQMFLTQNLLCITNCMGFKLRLS